MLQRAIELLKELHGNQMVRSESIHTTIHKYICIVVNVLMYAEFRTDVEICRKINIMRKRMVQEWSQGD
jgi:hypothetical protein